MIEFKPSNGNAERLAEIEMLLQKLNVEMESPNIKEIKYAELSIVYRQLTADRETVRKQLAETRARGN